MDRPGTTHCRRQYPKTSLTPSQGLWPSRLLGAVSLSLGLCLSPVAGAAASLGERELVDRIVAEVNSIPILHSEVKEKVDHGPLVMVSEYPASDKDEPMTRALYDAINYELVMSKVEELEIEVSDAQVEEQINQILAQNKIDREGLVGFLQQQGRSLDDYKEDIHHQMLFMRFRGRVLMPLVKITDKDVESYYLKTAGSTADAINLYLRQILIRIPPQASPEVKAQKEKLADEVAKKLQAGADFLELEKIYSDLADAREGKPALAYKLSDLQADIRQAVAPLAEKQATSPISTSLGLHFFYMEQKKFTGSQEFQANKQEYEYKLRQHETLEQLRRWLKEAQRNSKIRLLSA